MTAQTRRTSDSTAAVVVALYALGLAAFVGQALDAQPWPVPFVAALVLIGAVLWLAISTGWVRR